MTKNEELQAIAEEVAKRQKFSPYACDGLKIERLKEESGHSFRSPFALDRDRILYSGAYRRYQGKTQVFSFTNQFDEEMSNRNLHTTYVSQISRTIAKMLGLNQELTEAIALGHDLGHAPFGHDGEKALSKCSLEYGLGEFHHNIQSLWVVDKIAKRGQGLNLTFAVRDGIVSHDGEVHSAKLFPDSKKGEVELQNYVNSKNLGKNPEFMPATMEGCVVRIADTIAYIGQDVEDAIRYGLIAREDLPTEVVEHLGDNNSKIVDTLIKSVVLGSYGKNYVAFSDNTADYLLRLKKFNYDKIYFQSDKNVKSKIEFGFKILFEKYLEDLQKKDKKSKIFCHFLDSKGRDYLDSVESEEDPRIVLDFISTMTDRYFNQELKEYLILRS